MQLNSTILDKEKHLPICIEVVDEHSAQHIAGFFLAVSVLSLKQRTKSRENKMFVMNSSPPFVNNFFTDEMYLGLSF